MFVSGFVLYHANAAGSTPINSRSGAGSDLIPLSNTKRATKSEVATSTLNGYSMLSAKTATQQADGVFFVHRA